MQTKKNTLSPRHTLLYAVVSIVIILNGCRGDEGPMGPRGPQGNANVYSAQYRVTPSSWTGDTNGYSATLPVPEITTDIYDNGAVLVYRIREESSENLYSYMLPNTYVDNTYIEYLDFDIYVGELVLRLKLVDNGVNVTPAPDVDYIFKVVIIEGTPLLALKEQVNIYDFKAVSKYFKLNDTPAVTK